MTDPALEHDQARLRQLDALVAEKVFGWTVEAMGVSQDWECGGWLICPDCEANDSEIGAEIERVYGIKPHQNHQEVQPCYRSDGSTQVVPEFTTSWDAAGQVVEKMRVSLFPELMGWRAVVRGPGVYAETAPLAICLAALKALGGSSPDEVREA